MSSHGELSAIPAIFGFRSFAQSAVISPPCAHRTAVSQDLGSLVVTRKLIQSGAHGIAKLSEPPVLDGGDHPAERLADPAEGYALYDGHPGECTPAWPNIPAGSTSRNPNDSAVS